MTYKSQHSLIQAEVSAVYWRHDEHGRRIVALAQYVVNKLEEAQRNPRPTPPATPTPLATPASE